MPTEVVVLGAGFAGLELASRLSESVADQVHVTLIDRSDSFVFGFSKLDVLFGRRKPEEVRAYYRDIRKPSVEVRQESVVSIDPATRRVVTDETAYDADVLVIALGADYDYAATPGLLEGGLEFYSPQGAARAAEVLPTFTSGTALIGVLGPTFKCPPAPNEAAFMLHDYLVQRGVRGAVDIRIATPLPKPIPISESTSKSILAELEARDIENWARCRVTGLDPATHVASIADGREVPYDLFLGIPVHVAPAAVVEAGLTEADGWIAVDPTTFATRWPDVYAVGDIASVPVPRAGVIAEGEARTLADVLIARITGGEPPPPYSGVAVCYIEMGDEGVGKVDVDFFAAGGPRADFRPPSHAAAEEKRQFGTSRLNRWFGYADS